MNIERGVSRRGRKRDREKLNNVERDGALESFGEDVGCNFDLGLSKNMLDSAVTFVPLNEASHHTASQFTVVAFFGYTCLLLQLIGCCCPGRYGE